MAVCKIHRYHGYSEILNGPFVRLRCNNYSKKLACGEKKREKEINAEKYPKFSSLPSCFCQDYCERLFKNPTKLKMSPVQTIKALPMGYHFIIESCKLLGSLCPTYIFCDVNLLSLAPLCPYIILKDIRK